jgi:RNA polymerase sigma-70 factor (sigma-E family)
MAQQDADDEFRDFVATRLDKLRRLAFLMCGDMQRAEDAVQLALTRLYSVWHRVDFNSTDSYANRIVINVVRTEQRRAWFRRERVVDVLPERSVSDSSAGTADRMAILAALAQLPNRQRAVVVLRFWEDRSVAETAKILRCSTGTVKSHTMRGLAKLRVLLGEDNSTMEVGVLV